MGKAVVTIFTEEDRDLAMRYVRQAPATTVITFTHRTRSSEQNARMWSMLTDFSEQMDWYGHKLKAEEWKDVFTAALRRERVVPGIDGGFVVLGQRTSKMSIEEMTMLMDLMSAFAAQHGVRLKVESEEGAAA